MLRAGGITLTLGQEPLFLLYDGAESLAAHLGEPALSLAVVPASVVRGCSIDLPVKLHGASAERVKLEAPPFWTVTKRVAEDTVTFTTSAPGMEPGAAGRHDGGSGGWRKCSSR